ncbi:hypothetical protein [Bailinhaonella thermotolerans]|uniref:hypothetical protein n=1 Tax=Bailinhaonella thermotolerans TaxID=1070861 RepID=UPI00192A604F|nr:hypothetical protein [Bailinhaonella thermotolerans]
MSPEFHLSLISERSDRLVREAAHHRLVTEARSHSGSTRPARKVSLRALLRRPSAM